MEDSHSAFWVAFVLGSIAAALYAWARLDVWLLIKNLKPKNPEFVRLVEQDWEFLEKQLSHKLAKKQWINFLDLQDLVEVWDPPMYIYDDIVYILAKYAVAHPEKTVYARVYERDEEGSSSGDLISGKLKVLVNLERFNTKAYYWK